MSAPKHTPTRADYERERERLRDVARQRTASEAIDYAADEIVKARAGRAELEAALRDIRETLSKADCCFPLCCEKTPCRVCYSIGIANAALRAAEVER